MSSNDVQTLANSIIGTSVLAMPYCFAKCGVILSILLLILSTIITRTCCHYLIKASIVTRRKNMELLGFYAFGQGGKTLVELSIIGFLMGTCIAFFVVIGDLCPILIQRIFKQNVNHDSLRFWLIIFTTLVFIIPLSLQKNIQSLSFVCKASIAFYVCLTIKTVLESFSRFQNDSHWMSNIKLWNIDNLFQCLPIFSMAMSCQMQLFEIYENITSFDRIRQNIFHATSICLVVYTIIGFFGYAAFYNQTLSGNILVNFTPSIANDIITLGFILSIACSFPLVIFPCRTSLSSLIYRKVHHSEISPYIPESRYKPLTLFIIISTMIIGILIPNVEVIIGFVGSTIGTLICVIFPSFCFIKIMQRNTSEKVIAQLIIIIGFVIMILGTYSNLNALESSQERAKEVDSILHLKNIESNQNENPPLAKDDIPIKNIKDKENSILQVNNDKDENLMKISEDGIKREEQEIAAAIEKNEKVSKDPQQEIKEKENEIKELKASKDKLEQEVLEMKQVLVKQNQETQQLVLQKFEEIAEKVEKIEKQSLDSLPSKDKEILDENEKKSSKLLDAKDNLNNDKKDELLNAPLVKLNDTGVVKTNGTSSSIIESEKVVTKNLTNVDHQNDAVVKLIKSQEPLSYQVGEEMSMHNLKNNTLPVENSKEPVDKNNENIKKKLENNVSQEDLKNEMRKKRDADFFIQKQEIIDPLNVQLNSIISRDLKAVNDEN
ncbi:hypothetical protein PVAND_006669 [Polypedilum vanderplanki]|uniref:Amino acid transporter transmembrane domain-containing protein n=1 Tax=Polypedilum vanderplanki TaxID=319348 RepID=A0A9J6C5K4_POLVA|nr:hypothetical protein PVAND_006669 [Polypedilum vanderplanki]